MKVISSAFSGNGTQVKSYKRFGTSILLGLLWGTVSYGQHLANSPAANTIGRTPVTLEARNTEFDVPLRGRSFVLHGYLPTEIPNDAPLVIYSSGSGGWHEFDDYIATSFAQRGMPVFGVSTHSYLKDFYNDDHPATSTAVVEDYLELIKQAKNIAKMGATQPVILAGWSLGAGYAPLVAADARIKPDVLGVISFSLSRENETALTVSHRLMSRMLGHTFGPSFDVSEYLARVAPVPVAIIQAARDRTASPQEAQKLIKAISSDQASTVRLFQVTAGHSHSFAGARSQVDQTLDEVLGWIRSRSAARSPEPDSSTDKTWPVSTEVAFVNHAQHARAKI